MLVCLKMPYHCETSASSLQLLLQHRYRNVLSLCSIHIIIYYYFSLSQTQLQPFSLVYYSESGSVVPQYTRWSFRLDHTSSGEATWE